jgi:hypothetical protein
MEREILSEQSTQICSCRHKPHFGRCQEKDKDGKFICDCQVISYRID